MSPEVGSPQAESAPLSDGTASLRMPDGALVAKRDAPVGGQAVLEGVMMRGVTVWAVPAAVPTARSRSAPSRSSPGPSATASGGCRCCAASSPSASR